MQRHSFSSQKKLVTLDLSNNLILSLESNEIFAINLYLNGNRLRVFNRVAVTVTGKKPELNLVLSGNNLTAFPASLVLNKLVCNGVFLTSNMIREMPFHAKKKGEPSLIRLIRLHLNKNQMEVIDENSLLNKFKLLEFLDLSENLLSELKNRTFKEQFAMRFLNLSYNRIQYISSELFSFNNKLEWLDLSQNSIVHIEEFSFAKLTMLKSLYLNSNDEHLTISEQIRGNSSEGLGMLKKINLSSELFHANASHLQIMMSMFGRSKLNKDMLGIKFLYSSRIDYYPNSFNYTVEDCLFILYSIRRNILLNMGTQSDLDAFVNRCKFIDLKKNDINCIRINKRMVL